MNKLYFYHENLDDMRHDILIYEKDYKEWNGKGYRAQKVGGGFSRKQDRLLWAG